MAANSKIEWTDATWNPVRGCSLVSPGCTNCYAMRQAHRHANAGGPYEGLTKKSKGGPVWTGKVRTVPELLGVPGGTRKPRRIFVNSMSDLFHEGVPDSFIADVWLRMALSQQHVFQILTKRPQRMLQWVIEHGQDAVFAGEELEYQHSIKAHGWPLRNVWLGVSVEDQARADERIQLLLRTPAAVRWISAEPLLGPIDLARAAGQWDKVNVAADYLSAAKLVLPVAGVRIDWVVAGGESGPGARPMHLDWARSLRDQCAAANVPFFFKQWGAWLPDSQLGADGTAAVEAFIIDEGSAPASTHAWLDGSYSGRVRKKEAGRFLDGRTHDEYPA